MTSPLVLVVDDEEKNLKLFKAILTREGLEVILASSGEAAVKLAGEKTPDLILLDVMMPGLNGFEACRQLKNDARTQMIPVLMVTALKEKEDRVMALQAGADDFLSKPIDHTELVVRAKSLLRIKRYYDDLIAKNHEIQQKSARLEKLEELKDNLFHMVIHDLRSPLMSITGSIELFQLDSAALTPNQNTLVDVCFKSCRELRQMIDSILDIYRLENQSLELKKEAINWNELIEEIEPTFLVQAQAKEVHLTVDSTFETDCVSGDRGLLTRVVSNLLSNSIRHTPGGGTVSLVSEMDSSANALKVSIVDSGNGIPKEYHLKIFDRFQQVGENQPGRLNGSCGLGLTFCKMVVEAHAGKIWVESGGEGQGAKFFFQIPL